MYSNAEANYPAPLEFDDANSWPRWKHRLSDRTELLDLGFHPVDARTYKRIEKGLALYITTPGNAYEQIDLWAAYVDHRLLSSRATADENLARLVLSRRSNSDIVCSMEG